MPDSDHLRLLDHLHAWHRRTYDTTRHPEWLQARHLWLHTNRIPVGSFDHSTYRDGVINLPPISAAPRSDWALPPGMGQSELGDSDWPPGSQPAPSRLRQDLIDALGGDDAVPPNVGTVHLIRALIQQSGGYRNGLHAGIRVHHTWADELTRVIDTYGANTPAENRVTLTTIRDAIRRHADNLRAAAHEPATVSLETAAPGIRREDLIDALGGPDAVPANVSVTAMVYDLIATVESQRRTLAERPIIEDAIAARVWQDCYDLFGPAPADVGARGFFDLEQIANRRARHLIDQWCEEHDIPDPASGR